MMTAHAVTAKESSVRLRFASPLGDLVVTANEDGLTSLDWLKDLDDDTQTELRGEPVWDPEHDTENSERNVPTASMRHAVAAVRQVAEYFRGERRTFDVPLVLHGTAFQEAVWHALLEIPYGETRSYGDIAKMIGNERAVRAVGQANRRNPVPIIVPCHRVIGTNGGLVGYAGAQVGLKAALLDLERSYEQE